MQNILVLFVYVLRFLSLQPPYNRGEINLICRNYSTVEMPFLKNQQQHLFQETVSRCSG